MEKVIGPTISVSQDNIYIIGTSEDNVSGTAIYRYDPPDKTGTSNSVSNVTGKYTAPKFELTTSGIWTFYAQDAAGNSNTKQTSSITLYRCNYCNQKTISLDNHYRCPTHFASQSCSTSPSYCTIDLGSDWCTDSPIYVKASSPYAERLSHDWYCAGCGVHQNATWNDQYTVKGVCQKHLYSDSITYYQYGYSVCTNCNVVGTKLQYDGGQLAPEHFTCSTSSSLGLCNTMYVTNSTTI